MQKDTALSDLLYMLYACRILDKSLGFCQMSFLSLFFSSHVYKFEKLIDIIPK